MTFSLKEKISITVLLFLTYLIPTVPEWLHHSSGHFDIIIISAPIWLACFYIGPYWLHYKLSQFSFMRNLHVVLKGAVFVALMFVGAMLVNELHFMAFPHYRFTLSDQVTSAILGSILLFNDTALCDISTFTTGA
ncbi:hypothetical protein [Pseudoalteromonas sp.]|uniref:hypothetical protein n=1 Tax=Pseudoalteromonas sp. TaxID=53249 RepID=UPI0035644241